MRRERRQRKSVKLESGRNNNRFRKIYELGHLTFLSKNFAELF